MSDYDVIVIGGGPGGYVAAIRASQLGKKTAVIEKEFMGGVCLNIGCIPSKSLLKNASVARTLREGGKEFGFSFENLNLDFGAAVKRSRTVSEKHVKGVGFLMKKNKIDVHMGTAKLTAKDTVQVSMEDGSTAEHKAKDIIIATGASVAIPRGWTIDGEKIITYREAILQEKQPKSVIIIGAGAIGVEFATVWNSYGTEITIVEMLPRLLPNEDEEIGKELSRAFNKRKIKSMVGTKVNSIEATENGVKVTVGGEKGDQTLEAEQALVAIGWRPNSPGLGLEEAGVTLSEKGFIEIDERMATNVPGIWAIGDVTGKLMLAHVASAMGVIAAENIAGVDTVTLNYENMPRATYCEPQVASFGITEAMAKERGHEINVGKFPFSANGKATGLGETTGWIKIVSDAKYGEILGGHLIGPEVTELLPELTLAQMMELTSHEIARNVHAHPTLSEALMEAAEAVEGTPINL